VSTVLVVAPHPDDETLGCGGTLLRHCDEGDQINWLIVTSMLEDAGFKKDRILSRQQEIEMVSRKYGFSSVQQLGFRTAGLDSVPRKILIGEISAFVAQIRPNILYVPFRNDVHSDHGAVFDAVAACSKSFRYPCVNKIRAYETLSETEFNVRPDNAVFRPNLWIDISGYLEKKIEIMRMYDGEMGEFPFPRSDTNIRALATYRGALAGVQAAEAFVSLKELL